MTLFSKAITPCPGIDNLLRDLHTRLLQVLGASYRGLALHGSLALGDFDPLSSDIDLLVVTASALSMEQVEALGAMHQALVRDHARWAPELEVSYLPLAALPRHDPAHPAYPRLARGERLAVEAHHSDWIIQRHILREFGVVLYGPALRELIEPVDEAALRKAVLDIRWWWEEQAADPRLLVQEAYQAYAVLSMCRIRYTLEMGGIVSKPAAARWAMAAAWARTWAELIAAALAWRPGQRMDYLEQTVAYIVFTLEQSQDHDRRR